MARIMSGHLHAALLILVIAILVTECSGDPFDVRRHLDTKTPYWIQQDYKNWTAVPDGCSLLHVNLVARHGSREPTSGDIKNLDKLAKNITLHKAAIPDSLTWLRDWKNPYLLQDAGYLVFAGEEEHYNLSRRFMNEYFPSLFNFTYEPSRYPMRSTQVSRAGRSANAFGYGIFENKGRVGPNNYDPFFVTAANISLDNELRFFDTCVKYNTDVYDDPNTKKEKQLYSDMIMPGIAKKLTARINATGWELTTGDATNMWKACQLQASINNTVDQFCALFDEDDISQLNYLGDLSSYWEKGYGYPLDYTIACPLLKSFMDAVHDVTTTPVDIHSQRANLRFAHAETIMPFIALLGLFKDSQPLKHNSDPTFIASRRWRGSTLAPYASNVAFVTYNCSTDYRVRVLVNEREWPIPNCVDSNKQPLMYCPVETVKQIYKDALSCDFDKMCAIPPCITQNSDGDSNDDFRLDNKAGIVVLIVVLVFGMLLGIAILAGLWAIGNYVRRRNQWRGYGILGPEITSTAVL